MTKKLATILVLGAALSMACVSKKKEPKKGPQVDLSEYVLTEAPASIRKVGANFEGKITLLGYQMKKPDAALEPGDKVSYTLYWKVEKELGESGWKLFTHVLNEKNKRILNIDGVGPLRDYHKTKNQALPPSKWKVGKVYADEQTFTVPKKTAGERLRIVTGIWKGRDRLKLSKGPNAGDNRALVTTLSIAGGKSEATAKLPELRVDRLPKGKKPKIDGKLDDEVWKTAASTGDFVNVRTGEPDPKSSVKGRAKLLWDDENLYVGFEVEDENVVGGFDKAAKDPQLWTKDTVEIMIDPDGDGDNEDYYEIQVNPQNLVFDSRFDSYNKPSGGKDGPFGHQDWTAKLQSAVVVKGTLDESGKDEGYTVELAIPFKSFDKAKRVPPELGQTWRMNLYAMQDNGGVAWSPILGQGNFHKAARFGRVLFAEAGWTPPAASAAPAAASAAQAPSARISPASLREAVKKLKAPSSAVPPATGRAPAAPPDDKAGGPKPPSAPRPPTPAQPGSPTPAAP